MWAEKCNIENRKCAWLSIIGRGHKFLVFIGCWTRQNSRDTSVNTLILSVKCLYKEWWWKKSNKLSDKNILDCDDVGSCVLSVQYWKDIFILSTLGCLSIRGCSWYKYLDLWKDPFRGNILFNHKIIIMLQILSVNCGSKLRVQSPRRQKRTESRWIITGQARVWASDWSIWHKTASHWLTVSLSHSVVSPGPVSPSIMARPCLCWVSVS